MGISFSPKPHIQDGLGMLPLDKWHFYVGQFVNGKRNGRGFVLYHEHHKTKKPYWQRGTYEEVMATAEFDSCGRVIHTDNVGKWITVTETVDRWHVEQNGIWRNNRFVREIDHASLYSDVWKDALITRTDYMHAKRSHCPHDFRFENIPSVQAGIPYNIDIFVTPYDDFRLLACTTEGHPFILNVGEETTVKLCQSDEGLTETAFHLSYSADFKRNVDFILREYDSPLPPMAKEKIYLRALSCMEFRISGMYKPLPLPATIAAIKQHIPQTSVTQTPDGAYVISLPHDEWIMWEEADSIRLFSERAKGTLRIQNRVPEDFARFAAQAQDIWQYIDSKQ